MAFTTSDIPAPAPGTQPNPKPQMREFDLPSIEFTGYDPKGTTSITGSEIKRPPPPEENLKQENKTEATEETVTLNSPKISALLRKEQAQRQRELSLKQREKDLAEKLAKAERFEQLQTKMQAKDYSGAEELGLSNEAYTEYLIEKQAASNPQEEKYRELDSKLREVAKKQEELQKREYQANQSLWKQEIKSKVKANEEEFSSIIAYGDEAEGAVLHLINDSYDEDGTEYTAEEAAKLVEQTLLAQGEKFLAFPKLQKRLGEKLGPPKTSPKTLTQTMTVTSQKQSQKPFHLMSESEQLAEAIRRVQEEKLNRR